MHMCAGLFTVVLIMIAVESVLLTGKTAYKAGFREAPELQTGGSYETVTRSCLFKGD